MLLWIRLALRNGLRNVRRSMLTATTVLVATALITVTLSWIGGLFGTMIKSYTSALGDIRIVSAKYAQREELAPLYDNIPDVDAMLTEVRKVPGVRDAEARITTGVAITASEEIGDEFSLVVGATKGYYEGELDAPHYVVAGHWLTGKPKEVVLGRRLADRIHAKLGTEVLLLGQTQYGSMSPVTAQVVGILAAGAMLDDQAYLPLSEVQWLTDMDRGAIEVLVYGGSTDREVLAPVVRDLRALPGMKEMSVEAWYGREPWLSMISMIGAIRGIIHGIVIFIAALAIFNTMSMSVLERTGEIGVMRAMGLGRLGAVGLFVVEALAIGLVGSIAGIGVGSLGAWFLVVHGITLGEGVVSKVGAALPMQTTFYGELDWNIVLTAAMLGLVIAVLGAILPALRAASIQPVLAMRARR